MRGPVLQAAFWSWFATVEGQPYGYHTFAYCWLDTARPVANLPEPIEEPAFTLTLTALDRLLGESGKVGVGPMRLSGSLALVSLCVAGEHVLHLHDGHQPAPWHQLHHHGLRVTAFADPEPNAG